MKEFMKTKKVTYNLMSFTGFKSLLIFSLLVNSPKTYKDIKAAILNNEFLHEDVSIDAIRVYLNSLKEIGCKIITTRKNGQQYFSIDSHPFELKIDNNQVKSLTKLFKAIYKNIDVADLISLQSFFDGFSKYIANDELLKKLKKASPLYNIDLQLVRDLVLYTHNNNEIIIYYNSATSGKKNITITLDKIDVNNGKLYIYGINSEYNNYSSFPVSKIIKIVGVNLEKSNITSPEITVGYELKTQDKEEIELLNNETLISRDDSKMIIEITSKNKFDIMQRIMSHTNMCKVLYPESFETYIVERLKKMKEGYLEQK